MSNVFLWWVCLEDFSQRTYQSKLVARDSDDGKIIVISVECIQEIVLGGGSSEAGHVDEQYNLSLVVAEVNDVSIDVVRIVVVHRFVGFVGLEAADLRSSPAYRRAHARDKQG